MLNTEMRKVSIGLSTGLEYEEAFYSSTDEVLQLAKAAAKWGGRYISHIRSEDIGRVRAEETRVNHARAVRSPAGCQHVRPVTSELFGLAEE